jgi:glycogen debranching enzyme
MNRQHVVLIFLFLSLAVFPAIARGVHVGYAVFGDVLSHEDSAAIDWLTHAPSLSVKVVRLDASHTTLPSWDVLWVNLPDSIAYQRCTANEQSIRTLKKLAASKTPMLCTGYAAYLANDLGLEPVRPAVRFDTLQNDWLWDKKGFQSYRGHPLLAGLFGGDYVWDAYEDQILPIIGYYGTIWPAQSSVVAVEKSYVFMHADRRIVTEARTGRSRLLSIGGLVYFGRRNALRRNMEQFVSNAISYLAGNNAGGPSTTWKHVDGIPRQFAVRTRPIHPAPGFGLRTLPSSGLMLTREQPHNDFFDLAGRRTLIMGRENGGIDEVWIHPIRVLRDYEAGIVAGDSVAWLKNLPVRVDVKPESFTRTYTLPGSTITELIFPSFDRAGGVVHYEATQPLRLVIRFRVDMRWMWPYDAGALGNLYFAFDKGTGALHVRDSSGTFACAFGADRPVRARLDGQYGKIEWQPTGLHGSSTTENQIASGAEYALGAGPGDAVNFAFVGTNEGQTTAESDYRSLLEHPQKAFVDLVGHYRDLLTKSVTVSSPDSFFNTYFPWAIVGTDRFVAHTPGLGTGLLAGFSTVNRGWNGEHKISGRPGYAWYFGRDAAWSGFAFDGYGDFASVRDQLALYQKYQDASGKIYHEMCTSGVIHFDASDATPLYVILAAHYLRASGDRAFIAKSWSHVQRAMAFLYSTDTDGDGLIENTNVGHGWVEPGGTLFGVHSELYLSVLWSEALRSAATIAQSLGLSEISARYAKDALSVQHIVDADFWNAGTEYYNYGKRIDGTYNDERTAFPSVGLIYGALDDAKARNVLSALAGNGFSTNWGVRILNSSSSHFNPRSYQEGSVWPLMTGWTALGEYTYGNSAQAYSHVMNILRIKKEWALGYVQEVMHGSVYRPGGVCPHQCWSETNILHPVIEGMIGWKPDAPSATASLSPRFPLDWDTVSVSNLRMGHTVIRMAMRRQMHRTVYHIERLDGPACTVRFAPEIPGSMEITGLSVNGKHSAFNRQLHRGTLMTPLVLALDKPQTVVLDHTGGAGVIPLRYEPVPGDSASGARILDAESSDGTYVITVEGKQGSTVKVRLAIFDDALPMVQGAAISWTGRPGEAELRVAFEPSDEPIRRATVRLQMR